MTTEPSLIREILEAARTRYAPDSRTEVFEVQVDRQGDRFLLTGQSTVPEAVEAVIQRLAAAHSAVEVSDHVVRLPDSSLQPGSALVRAAIAPILAAPRVSATQVSQQVLGRRVELLVRDGTWYRVRAPDGYIGWVHEGYLETADRDWVEAWERGDGGEPAVSLGADFVEGDDRPLMRLPWGARLVEESPTRFRLPDGRRGRLAAGEVVAVDRLQDRFPPRGDSVVRTAMRWLGAPYQWGGVTPWGVDCSGFVQSVFAMHGVALPRDSDMQAKEGFAVEPGRGFRDLRPGDLLLFAETGDRVTHVAISLGKGRVVHAALSNGGVAIDDLEGGGDVARRLRPVFVEARRVLESRP